MNFTTALNQGYIFTGATWRSWDEEKDKQYKARIKELKAKYKDIECRIVTGTNSDWLCSGYKGLVGNQNFCRVWDLSRQNLQKKLDDIPCMIKTLEDDYKENMRRIQSLKDEVENNIAFLKSLEKK